MLRPAKKLQWKQALIGGDDGKPAICTPEKSLSSEEG
jgi:hypothetical protein